MKLNVGNEKVKISHNENNRFWNPFGQFHNIIKIKIGEKWYKCGLTYLKKDNEYFIRFSDPMLVDKKTLIIKEVYIHGIYKEVKVSKFKFNFIQYLENTHRINNLSFKLRKGIFDRKGTIGIFLLAIIPTFIFYIINVKYDNIIIKLIADNTWIQTFFFFLTISGFIGIFQPFTIKKELEKEDIINIIRETQEEDKRNEEIRRNATF
jgi:hypothetical protein